MPSAMCAHIEECVKGFSTGKSKKKIELVDQIKALAEESTPYTLDQLVFHCSDLAQKAHFSESEMKTILSDIRRRNA